MEAQPDGEIINDTKQLLKGDEYHVALFKKYNGGVDPPSNPDSEDTSPLPTPFVLSEDEGKAKLLETAFEHLKGLKFTDLPDYDLIRQCLEGFLDGSESANVPGVLPIDWSAMSEAFQIKSTEPEVIGRRSSLIHDDVPLWELLDVKNPLESADQSMFVDTDPNKQNKALEEEQDTLEGEEADLARLPLEMRFRIAQMDYNASNHATIESHLALQDWLRVALPLLYGAWDTKEFERGGHRSENDGFRRESFLNVADRCLQCASAFGGFRDKSCYFDLSDPEESPPKKRKVHSTDEQPNNFSLGSDLLVVSKALFELRMVKQAEERLSRAPPPMLSF
ncbi:MAG: hypothetical protein SGARI_004527 [Bacillariaceae sp.]